MGVSSSHHEEANFEPKTDFAHEEDCDTLILHLPGFTKDQLRVQLIGSRLLRITGSNPHFKKEFPVSVDCDTDKVSANFDGGVLYVKQPKLSKIVTTVEAEQSKLTPEVIFRSPDEPAVEDSRGQRIGDFRAVKMKRLSREVMSLVVADVMAFMLGLYAGNRLIYSRNSGNK